jgi:hypothetical protein
MEGGEWCFNSPAARDAICLKYLLQISESLER